MGLMTPTATSSITSTPIEVLRCEGTADFLAALPRLLGFTPTNSLLIVFFSGNRSGSTLRVDLPTEDSSRETAKFLDGLCSLLRQLRVHHGPGSPAVVISCEQTFAASQGIPWRKFARALERRLAREGDRVRELCCIAPDAWASYLDPATPLLGRALQEISSSTVAVADAPPRIDELGSFAQASPKECIRVAAALERRMSDANIDAWARAAHASAALVGVTELSTDTIADTIASANSEDGWIVLFEQIVATAEQYLSPEAVSRPKEQQHEAAHRLKLASYRLTRTASLAPLTLQAPVMAASAIAWWLRGLQSVAHRQIGEAFALDPHCEPVRVVRKYMRNHDYAPFPLHP